MEEPEKEILYSYTSDQAESDGVLYDITKINPEWKKGIFNYITTSLLLKGYMEDSKIKIANLLDLLNQSNQIVKTASQVKDQLSPFIEIIRSINDILKQIENRLPKEVLSNVA